VANRVGVFGGTFDPPHIGHLIVADQVLDQLGLDEVRLVVTNRPWQKVGSRAITPAPLRLRMVAAAAADTPGVVACDIELELGGSSYTVVTLEELSRREPGTDHLVIIGSDAAAGLDTWHRADELRERCTIVVVNRPGDDGGAPPGWAVEKVRIPPIDLSSTEIRALVAEGRSIRHLTPPAVVQLLTGEGLYRRAM
jgi:nicotinate-nucleotide adenylyltransferase